MKLKKHHEGPREVRTHASINLHVNGLVWFITLAGKCLYVCVVGTALYNVTPRPRYSQPGRALNHGSHAQRTLAFVVLWTLQIDPQLHYTPRSVSSSLSLCLSRSVRHGRAGGVEAADSGGKNVFLVVSTPYTGKLSLATTTRSYHSHRTHGLLCAGGESCGSVFGIYLPSNV